MKKKNVILSHGATIHEVEKHFDAFIGQTKCELPFNTRTSRCRSDRLTDIRANCSRCKNKK